MTHDKIVGILAILAIVMGFCTYLIPKPSQDALDDRVNALSQRVRGLTFWNFATIERDVAFSWLEAIFRAKPHRLRFYRNVAIFALLATLVALGAYLIVPFSDPLNVQLVGYPAFLAMGFFIPNMIVAVLSMACTITLLSVGARLRNGLFYILVAAVDFLVVTTLVAALSLNLELTRDYLVAVFMGKAEVNRWLPYYQPILAIMHVILHPSAIVHAFTDEIYISSKYTTYIISVISMMCAVIPGIIHLFAAIFISLMAVFHNGMKQVGSFLLARMNEQKTFKFLLGMSSIAAACIKVWDWLFANSV
ncbi:hypothetical protein [Mesorhizobium huakuii]|uniref:Uncharacterized protein n=1 Tax=Mesorhizobium huakuii TaxID=28104 RepID=A0A7G6T0X9_9HYPH|nr:hypothetical protein [Mesorhizobium huakuii]QND60411.1 hypothetical protein HB778_30580 [Mesorhizobium huakuii]